MTRIRATCPTCGEVDLHPRDVQLEILRDRAGVVGDGSSYRFDCPTCTAEVTKPADERVARLLATGGVAISITRTDVDLADLSEFLGDLPQHPEAPPQGPALTHDDLLDFHALLDRDDWYAELETSA